jgi:hypothetical protein
MTVVTPVSLVKHGACRSHKIHQTTDPPGRKRTSPSPLGRVHRVHLEECLLHVARLAHDVIGLASLTAWTAGGARGRTDLGTVYRWYVPYMSDYPAAAGRTEARRISAAVRELATGRKLHLSLDEPALAQLAASGQLQLVLGDVDFVDAGPGTIKGLEELTINVL